MSNNDHRTRSAILTYIMADPEPRPLRMICLYMHTMHRVDNGATREMIHRLFKRGVLIRPSRGYYGMKRR